MAGLFVGSPAVSRRAPVPLRGSGPSPWGGLVFRNHEHAFFSGGKSVKMNAGILQSETAAERPDGLSLCGNRPPLLKGVFSRG
ncbi:MAG: hypothetical protein CW342_02960 [Thermoactinomycetaceae bacterium]|jgi:hypothetical protein|nr:hypothetical protein [Bacillota bacterium]MBO2531850.1 hypothetical protein [Thermoactinomycetaceae bacterium]